MQQMIGLFITSMITIFIIDIIWLGYIAKDIYQNHIGTLLRKSADGIAPIWPSAIVVYICIAIGIMYFVLPRANGNYLQALIWGALFGAVTYGVYDFTNHSILMNWPFKITMIDFIWGIVLCSLSSLIITFFFRIDFFLKPWEKHRS